ncbi:MAG TPA: OmpA family protein [Dokdonella sp.]|uniref:OmpA family protein n=1 Tax=Dokdonella sp. TaxID=2291710 RepID=UPI0025BDCA69|nr:OmpA family protein [Dokdonella sp.]MBX3691761.1 OmpA family protein [Dokdonella sp.]MCW5568088.1 OmpA family protein [Dokdonella sp.]HNR92701.1 OmpA family protein [Dokdonella sp.]
MSIHPILFRLAAGLCVCVAATTAFAAGGGDHPLVGRYESSELVGRHVSAFDEVELMNGPITGDRGIGAPGWMRVEGRITLLYYRLPEGRSSLEVLRNYQASLEAKGFAIAFTCATSNGSCYETPAGRTPRTDPYSFALALDANPELPKLSGDFVRNHFGTNARHLLARRAGGDGTVYVSISLAEHAMGNHAIIRVVETKEMDSGKIGFVGADEMSQRIAADGRISLYGIHFDFDKDVVREDSRETLAEIAKVLRNQPDLRLAVVGHTDNQGGVAYNRDLSQRRAASVVRALANDHGIDTTRLKPRGAGADQPVAANDSEEGRAKNRRVELVRL